MPPRVNKLAAWLGVASSLVVGCRTETSPTTSTTTTSTTSTAGSSAPTASASAKNAYVGPTGTVKGTIRIVGDDPPNTPFSYPEGCELAAGTYGKLFRRGLEGQLADALVAVSGYKGYVPPKDPAVKVTIKDCAYSMRTIVVAAGQHIEINNLDPLQTYIPHLDGAKSPSTNAAIPRGPTVKVYTRGNTRYWLRNQMGMEFMMAHVWQVPFSTFQVTGLDGRYEISGVPVGKASLDVMLPQLKDAKSLVVPLTKKVSIDVKEGDNVFDVELVFDAKTNTPLDGHGGTKPRDLDLPPVAPSGSASAKP